MDQRKEVPRKRGIHDENFNSDEILPNLKLSSSQHQDGKSRVNDMKKRMKKSRSFQVSDLEALQSSPSSRILSQPGRAPPLHVPTTAASQQKHIPLVRTANGTPNYMKHTSSSDAKKELSPVNFRNSQYGSDGKNLSQKFSSDSKATSVCSKKPPKTLTRSSSLNLVTTLAQTPNFKPFRACPRKSTRVAVCADMNAPDRATCSSTLKDSNFPAYLMLNPGSTESEGTSVMKVCPYTYCSLNGHCHTPLPPLKSFVSARGRLLKAHKSMKLEALSPPRLRVPCQTNQYSDIEQNAFDGKLAYDEVDMGNPMITPLVQDIGMDFFIEIYAKEKEAKPTAADKMGKFDSVKDLEDQEDIKFIIDENGTPRVNGAPPESEIDHEEDFKKYSYDVAIKGVTKGSILQEHNADDADENHMPSWFHEEDYYGEISYDGEHMKNIEMDDSDSQATDMEWEEEKFVASNYEDDIDLPVFTEEETNSKFESLSESSHDVSMMWPDDIHNSDYVDILVEEAVHEADTEESTCSEAQPRGTNSVMEGTSGSMETQETVYQSNDISCKQSSSTDEVFQHLTNAEDNDRENEKHVDNVVSCAREVLDGEAIEKCQGRKTKETCEIDDTGIYSNSSQENSDESISQKNQIHSPDVPNESTVVVQDQKLLEGDQGKASKFPSTSCIGGEEQNTSNNWKGATRRKIPAKYDEEMRKFNPRGPNFLPLVPEPEPEKVNLKHQMMDERKNAEEWMLDYALRQAVTKLAPAGKRKVALLVEAFETVMSIPKCETRVRDNSPFSHARPIQACS